MKCVGVPNEILERSSSPLECYNTTETLPGMAALEKIIIQKFDMIEKNLDKSNSGKL